MRILLVSIMIFFVAFCGWLVLAKPQVESGFFTSSSQLSHKQTRQPCVLLQQTINEQEPKANGSSSSESQKLQVIQPSSFHAEGGPAKTIPMGSIDPKSGFEFQLKLSSKGAAIKQATFSKFDNRDRKNPQPLVFLSPVRSINGREILSLSNSEFVLVDQQRQFDLDGLSWKSFDKEIGPDGSEKAIFEAVITDPNDEQVIKLTKSYVVVPDTYLLQCELTIENMSGTEQEVHFNLTGPVGLGREAFRSDMRKVIAGFKELQGSIISTRLNQKALEKAKTIEDRKLISKKANANFLWAAATNKYFSAILVPMPDEGKDYCDWVIDKTGSFYNPDRDSKANSGDETIGLNLAIASAELNPRNQQGSSKTYNFELFLGPKDKSLFDKNPRYKELGFVQAIDFMPCFCCPASIINPLAFAVLAIMNWMYGFIGNYGIVIIILVFIMRLIMHPITKKSQVSMSKMSTLAPKTEEIKKKYANNKAEMNKQLMALYREQGASPIMGMLPMIIQMPIWIALWSAVNASIDLRGAPFLPFWITDLSIPDAAYTFPTALTVPLLGWKIESLNLLPILMGLAFYLQQKLMPSQSQASTNPQVAQQQKIMMIMLPLLFPLMLYKAPSGVNLYIMASTFAGVIEQYVIRKHIRKKEDEESKGLVSATSKTGGKVKKKKPKPFFKT
jgi:YidC/Oxa1 family membrane protein insertase